VNGKSLRGEAASAARGWKHPVLPFNPQAIGKPALIIDALFGAGLNRTAKGEPHDMIAAINANGAPVLSVDLPSGINGTTAAVMGIAVRGYRNCYVLPVQAGAFAFAGSDSLWSGARRGYRDSCARARRNSSTDLRKRSVRLAQIFSSAADRWP